MHRAPSLSTIHATAHPCAQHHTHTTLINRPWRIVLLLLCFWLFGTTTLQSALGVARLALSTVTQQQQLPNTTLQELHEIDLKNVMANTTMDYEVLASLVSEFFQATGDYALELHFKRFLQAKATRCVGGKVCSYTMCSYTMKCHPGKHARGMHPSCTHHSQWPCNARVGFGLAQHRVAGVVARVGAIGGVATPTPPLFPEDHPQHRCAQQARIVCDGEHIRVGGARQDRCYVVGWMKMMAFPRREMRNCTY